MKRRRFLPVLAPCYFFNSLGEIQVARLIPRRVGIGNVGRQYFLAWRANSALPVENVRRVELIEHISSANDKIQPTAFKSHYARVIAGINAKCVAICCVDDCVT